MEEASLCKIEAQKTLCTTWQITTAAQHLLYLNSNIWYSPHALFIHTVSHHLAEQKDSGNMNNLMFKDKEVAALH